MKRELQLEADENLPSEYKLKKNVPRFVEMGADKLRKESPQTLNQNYHPGPLTELPFKLITTV